MEMEEEGVGWARECLVVGCCGCRQKIPSFRPRTWRSHLPSSRFLPLSHFHPNSQHLTSLPFLLHQSWLSHSRRQWLRTRAGYWIAPPCSAGHHPSPSHCHPLLSAQQLLEQKELVVVGRHECSGRNRRLITCPGAELLLPVFQRPWNHVEIGGQGQEASGMT